MAETNYEERVKKIIASTLNISEEKIKLEDKIIEDLSADSLDVIELIIGDKLVPFTLFFVLNVIGRLRLPQFYDI